MQYLENCSATVERFVRSSSQFKASCDAAFAAVDLRGTGRVSATQAAAACVVFFKDVSAAVDDFGIRIKEPSVDEVKKLLQESGYRDGAEIDRAQFEELYVAILKWSAVKCCIGFAQKYGAGMALGVAALMVVKRCVRAIPLVGTMASPLLGLLPTPLLGPVLGVLGVYVAEGRDLGDVKRRLFGSDGGQFKSG